MKKRFLMFLLGIILFAPVQGQIVAKVGKFTVMADELEKEMRKESPASTAEQRRELALNRLVNQYVLLNYAMESGLTVSTGELEEYFAKVVGDHPKFATNGRFDRSKYLALKNTSEVQTILATMERDLLLKKAETAVRDMISVSDAEVVEKFIRNKINIDLSYIVVPNGAADLPSEYTPARAYDYFLSSAKEFLSRDEVKLEIHIVDESSLENPPRVDEAEMLAIWEAMKLKVPYAEVRDSLRQVLKARKTNESILQEASLLRKNLVNHVKPARLPLVTGFLAGETVTSGGSMLQEILGLASEMVKGEVSEVVMGDRTAFVFRLLERRSDKAPTLSGIGPAIWKRYLDAELNRTAPGYLEQYYRAHIDSFAVNMYLTTVVELDPAKAKPATGNIQAIAARQLSLEREILSVITFPDKLKTLGDREGFTARDVRVVSAPAINTDPLGPSLLRMIRSHPDQMSGQYDLHGKTIIYQVQSWFPEYLPDFSQVRSEVYRRTPVVGLIPTDEADESECRAYYDRMKGSVSHKGKVEISGIFFRKTYYHPEPDEDEVRLVYESRATGFIAPAGAEFQSIYLPDADKINESFALSISQMASSGVSWAALSQLFDEEGDIPSSGRISYKDLPPGVGEALRITTPGEVTQPVYSGSGWYILKKKKHFAAGTKAFADVREQIARELSQNKAGQMAFDQAARALDTLSELPDPVSAPEGGVVFRSDLREITSDFPEIGNLTPWADRLMKLSLGSKFPSILQTAEGCGVVWLVNKVPPGPISFGDMLPELKRLVAEDNRRQRVKNYLNTLVKSLREGADPHTTLTFFGEWKRLQNLSIGDQIPGVDNSDAIIQDIVRNRKKGDYSPPLPLAGDRHLIYRVDNLEKPARNEFSSDKNKMSEEVRFREYNRWLSEYRQTIEIIINQ